MGGFRLCWLPWVSTERKRCKRRPKRYDLKGTFRLERWPLGGRGRFLREINPHYLNTHGFRFKSEDRESLLKLVRASDLVWFHSVRLPNAAGIEWISPSLLDVDDLMSRYHASAATQVGMINRLLERKRSWQWQRRERLFLQRFDALAVCSEADRAYLGGSERIHVIPNGFEKALRQPKRTRNGVPTIGFVGSLRYPANRDGVVWFIEKVWPIIRQKMPEVRLRLAGENSTELAANAGHNVEGVGWVDDIGAEMSHWSLTIVPVHVGGGTRVKIATAFSLACPVVSTTWGASGYEVRNGFEILLADEPADFSDACCRLLQDESFANQMATNAAEVFEKKWTWEAIAPCVSQTVERALLHGHKNATDATNVSFRLGSLE